jgi:hypothetical protein
MSGRTITGHLNTLKPVKVEKSPICSTFQIDFKSAVPFVLTIAAQPLQ